MYKIAATCLYAQPEPQQGREGHPHSLSALDISGRITPLVLTSMLVDIPKEEWEIIVSYGVVHRCYNLLCNHDVQYN